MLYLQTLLALFFVIFFSSILSPFLVNTLNLVDHPDNHRKIHANPTPLIGGILVLVSVSILYIMNYATLATFQIIFLTAIGLLVLGIFDDKYDIDAKIRLVFQIIAACILIFLSQTKLLSFGDIFFMGDIELGIFSIPITIVAVVGMINALNLIDGIDGLASGLALICFVSLAWLLQNSAAELLFLLCMCGAIAGFMLLNLELLPIYKKKMFLGDAGSLVLGFITVFFLVEYSQGQSKAFNPVTALWIISIPLIDIAVTLIRRVLNGRSPFYPDKTHIHHILMQSGMCARQTLVLLLGIQCALSVIGILLDSYESISFMAFLVVIVLYVTGTILVNKKIRVQTPNLIK